MSIVDALVDAFVLRSVSMVLNPVDMPSHMMCLEKKKQTNKRFQLNLMLIFEFVCAYVYTNRRSH